MQGAAARQEEINRGHKIHHEETETMRQTILKREEYNEIPTEVSCGISSSSQIRLQQSAKPFMMSSVPQDKHRHERGSIQTKGFKFQKF